MSESSFIPETSDIVSGIQSAQTPGKLEVKDGPRYDTVITVAIYYPGLKHDNTYVFSGEIPIEELAGSIATAERKFKEALKAFNQS